VGMGRKIPVKKVVIRGTIPQRGVGIKRT